jgi:hypothetical protein
MPAVRAYRRDRRSATALVYKTTEEARLLLRDAADAELAEARIAAGEAAYYLSDTIEPDERASLLMRAGRRLTQPGGARASEAFELLSEVVGEVEGMLTGPSASSDLHIAQRALRRAIGNLASHLGLAAGQASAEGVHHQRLGALHRLNPRHQ